MSGGILQIVCRKSGFDKSESFAIMRKMASWHLGFVMKLIMRKAPPFSYYEQFSPEAKKYILKDFATKVEDPWQSLMQEYLTFSEQSILLRANNSGHIIFI